MRKPTLHDVARTAGVSYATADRVLNARGGVAQKSALRVQQAIQDLGYQRDLHAANLSRRRTYAFRFYLPQGDHSFFDVLRRAVELQRDLRAVDRVTVEIHETATMNAAALAEALDQVEPGSCDCIAMVGIDTPRVTAAIARLRQIDIPVVTLIGDAGSARAAYVGIDNIVAGQTVGRLLSMAHIGRTGQVLPIIGAHTQADHRDRLFGAGEVLAQVAPQVTVLPAIVVHDRSDLMQQELARALVEYPQTTALYSIGAGNRALVSIQQARGANRLFAVLHEVTDVTRIALEQGVVDAVIDQNPSETVARVFDVMKSLVDGVDLPQRPEITPNIYLKDNLPRAGS